MPQPAGLTVPADIHQQMVVHALATLPNESVGLLATVRAGDTLLATAYVPGTNVDASPMRYTMDPTEVRETVDRWSAAGWSLGAIVHSHPVDPAEPSETDLREHRYPDALMGIISLATRLPDLRAWSRRPERSAAGGRMVEITVRVQARPTSDEEHW